MVSTVSRIGISLFWFRSTKADPAPIRSTTITINKTTKPFPLFFPFFLLTGFLFAGSFTAAFGSASLPSTTFFLNAFFCLSLIKLCSFLFLIFVTGSVPSQLRCKIHSKSSSYGLSSKCFDLYGRVPNLLHVLSDLYLIAVS